jgi:Flagellar motor protein
MNPASLQPLARRPRKKPAPSAAQSGWLTTFADMTTLILTFMVLLISITTLDPHTDLAVPEGDAKEQAWQAHQGGGALLFSNRGLMAPALELVEKIDRLPDEMMFDPEEIKAAIFQLDPDRTTEYEQLQEALAEGVKIGKDSRGLVIQWDRSLLFPEGGVIMYEQNLALLRKMAAFLGNIKLPVSVEGHTNAASELEGGRGPAAYDLSLRRARVVMEYLLSLGLPEKRFRIGGYGGGRPLNNDPQMALENSRLDIVIYKPAPGALFGN